ncbi:cell envelope integrity protein TolA [Hafnia paralvei]|uniref:cell envelope integrity protein TolA n=1 Tax=Hafnia paralvei TaxID=546367 RepID=UPI00187D1E0A|nr:cell envelope integrity protein TolA [Hafnia paralvei]
MKSLAALLWASALCSVFLLTGCSSQAKSQSASSRIDKSVSAYAGDIQSEIERHFRTQPSFKGKICDLRIKLAQDGLLLGVIAEGGDPELCAEAMEAVKLAKFPKPPSNEVYQIFKNTPINVRPD